MASGAVQRLGAPETLGISTLDPGHRPPAMPPGRHVTVRVRMLDDTEELFDISRGKFPPQRAEYQMVEKQKGAREHLTGRIPYRGLLSSPAGNTLSAFT
ncbi:FERM, RhoGEF and pleckstrin domain-containing protein 1 [Liparis tanakae]|uniref:FERM, RhoGEF and pleckstrin domain-containing protein 1 n=1 Tax=Liparis tanakae TaxID=230148 RepID=A0A4Z2GMQ1_9TELE|nr:FERM, RhoGEF and pleckstrin domain-containing protein 1 [Liparis tanakae]